MKNFYIIPGWQDTGEEEAYQELAKQVKSLGYQVSVKKVKWDQNLSDQKFPVEADSAVFGFSLGAILAWLVVQDFPCDKLILGSMTPHYSFSDSKIEKDLADLTGKPFVDDIKISLRRHNLAKKQIVMYGDQEGEKADILVKDTDHEVNDAYIKEIVSILKSA